MCVCVCVCVCVLVMCAHLSPTVWCNYISQVKRLLANVAELDARGERLHRAQVSWREKWQSEVWSRIQDANA